MKKAADFLDDLRAEYGLTSDYQIHKMFGMAVQQISRYRKGKSTFDDTTALKMAELLHKDASYAGYIAACMNAQRAQTPEARKVWEKVAKTVGAGTALAFALAVAYALAPDQWMAAALAFPALPTSGRLYIMLNVGSVAFAIISVSYLYLSTLSPASARAKQ